MKIVVMTPMGHVGKHLTSALIRGGIRPLLLTRNPGRIPKETLRYADAGEVDSTDPRQVVAATRGVDAVYWVDPSVVSANPLADYAQATRSIVEAVGANGIGRVVFQSSVGAEKRHGVGEIDGLAATEVALNELEVDVTHLRCGYFFTNLLMDIESIRRGRLSTVLPLDRPMSWVAPRDIADIAALTLLNPDWRGHRVQAVHGPRDLTWNDVAAILSRRLNYPVRVEQISDRQMRERYLEAGMPPGMADAVLGMSTGLRDDFRAEQQRTLQTTTPTHLSGWVEEELIPAL